MSKDLQNNNAVSGLINFHGLTLWVIEHEGAEYIYAKPLTDLAGIDWRRAKKTIQSDDNAILYGSRWLTPPVFVAERELKLPSQQVLCIRLDRAQMYLARINTGRMRENGAHEAAELLLKLQVEWASVLHCYETKGEAERSTRVGSRRREEQALSALIKTRRDTLSEAEESALTAMINDKLCALGYPPGSLSSEQLTLEV